MKATVEKVFPIKGRTDFFKYVIKDEGVIVKDFEGKEMYFDSFNLKQANLVCEAYNNVNDLNSSFIQ